MEVLIVLGIAFWVIVNSINKMQKVSSSKRGNTARSHMAQTQRQQTIRPAQSAKPAEHKPAAPVGSLGETVPMQSSEGLSAYRPMEHRLSTTMNRSEFVGSLGVDSTEGMDICDPSLEHDRETASAFPTGLRSNGASGAISGFAMDKNALLQGVIMNEILTRPQQRKWGRCSHG